MPLDVHDSIVSRIERNAAAHASRPFAIFYGQESITWTELLDRSRNWAGKYRELGLVPGDVAILIFRHSPHMLYAFVGALLAGVVPSFMPYPTPKQDPDVYWASHAKLFARIRPRLIVTYRDNAAQLAKAVEAIECRVLIEDELEPSEPLLDHYRARCGDIAFLQHSSGTTSLKKGVMLAHGPVLEQVAAYAPIADITCDSIIASWLPLYHDMGLIACFIAPLITGASVVMIDPIEWSAKPWLLLDAIDRYRATHAWMPNFAFMHTTRVPNDKRWDLSSLKALINCSEPCKPEAFAAFAERFAVGTEVLRVCYAMAENVFAVTQTPGAARVLMLDQEALLDGKAKPTTNGKGMLSCGRTISGVEIAIVDETRRPLPEGYVGEVAIAGRSLFSGYHKLPEQTMSRVQDGWYYSNDLGFLHDGELYITGRKDDLMIVYGRNYYAHDVESVANRVPGVVPGRSVAVAIDNERLSTREVVVIVERDGAIADEELSRALKKAIFDHVGLMIARTVIRNRGWLVKTTSGKISRELNREKLIAAA